jgi:3-hydroxybutyrate dehydrogenase
MMLRSKSAVVTGSTSGIGLAIARAVAKEGANVVLNGFGDGGEIERARSGIEAEFGVRAIYSSADMAKPDEIAAMIRDAEKAFGAVDILVNNAGIQHVSPVEEFPPEKWDQIIAINLSSAFHAIRAAVPGMKRRGWGRILNMSSGYGLFGAAGRAGYVTTKTALIGLTRAVALETARDGITCNALCPGSVPTPTIEARIEAGMAARGETDRDAAAAAYLADKQPTRRFIAPEKVAAMAAFLCGPEADDITGAAIPIDGGWSAS